ncbi:MAG TPA: EAL domain-containing protein [Gammaproteobacteria bacterium]|nr:EAL domain-containing protein [Gammaproteobacteria bacterium]
MTSRQPRLGLKRRYLAATAALTLAALAVAALLLYAHSASVLSDRGLTIGLLGTLAAAGAGALVLVAALADGFSRPLRAVVTSLRSSASGNYEAATDVGPASELSELAEAVNAMRISLRSSTITRDYLDRLLSGMGEALLITDATGRIERANAAAGELFGLSETELVGKLADEIIVSSDRRRADGAASRPREGSVPRPDGTAVSISYTVANVHNDRGEVESKVYAAHNIDERKRVEQRIRYLARTDPLTKIANRMQFQHLLQQSIARARRTQQYVAILYMDVDRFKDINDTFGHSAGDTSLEIFARRVLAELPENAHAGRLAGDEFAALLTGYDRLETILKQLNELAPRLLQVAGKPFQVHGEEIFLTASMGIAVYPRDGDNVIDLIRNADAALYQAKKAGGNCFEFYSTDMNTAAVERLMLKSKLRRAFERDELRVHYQPKYRLKTGRLEGAEALLRWDLPERGIVLPSDFVPLAEETNLILQLGDWVLNRVCADYRAWQRLVPSPSRVSVNLSLRQLQQRRFLDQVRETFRIHGVSPTSLELEITETTLMEDPERTIRILDALYGMGLHLAIDDFGTGYSSLSALQQFPISTLKIDRSFVRDVAIDRDDAAIVDAIIQMAHSLQLEVVAEGVESEQQLDFLRKHGCDLAQGHLFGDSVTAEQFGNLLIAEAEGTGKNRALFARA